MPAVITYKAHDNYLLMEVKGQGYPEFVLPEGKKVWLRLSGLCKDLRKNQALLVISLQNHIPIGMSMELAQLAEENGWERGFKLGIIPDPDNRMTMDLMKSFLIHRGFETEVFDSLRTARRWLT